MAMFPVKANDRGNYRDGNRSMVLKQLFIGKGARNKGCRHAECHYAGQHNKIRAFKE